MPDKGKSYDLQVFFLVLIDALGVAKIFCCRPCSDPGIFVFGAVQAGPQSCYESEPGACYRMRAPSTYGRRVDGPGDRSFRI